MSELGVEIYVSDCNINYIDESEMGGGYYTADAVVNGIDFHGYGDSPLSAMFQTLGAAILINHFLSKWQCPLCGRSDIPKRVSSIRDLVQFEIESFCMTCDRRIVFSVEYP